MRAQAGSDGVSGRRQYGRGWPWLRLAFRAVVLAVTCFLNLAPADAARPPALELQRVRIAVIGDYGDGSQAAGDVAALVHRWAPDIVVTTGDNNYPDGAAETIDANVGRFYHDFIAPYRGKYGAGADVNRFFPVLGNHDWNARRGRNGLPEPYLTYFTLPPGPGQERYYDVVWGPVHIFVLDSDRREPHGTRPDSAQGRWLRQQLAQSSAPWKLVVMHEPPYSSGRHGSSVHMRWPFQAWGATATLSGHDHTYERIVVDGFPYFVNGLGGQSRYRFRAPVKGSQVRYNADSGAMLIEATPTAIIFRFVTRRGVEVDVYRIERKLQRRDLILARPAQIKGIGRGEAGQICFPQGLLPAGFTPRPRPCAPSYLRTFA